MRTRQGGETGKAVFRRVSGPEIREREPTITRVCRDYVYGERRQAIVISRIIYQTSCDGNDPAPLLKLVTSGIVDVICHHRNIGSPVRRKLKLVSKLVHQEGRVVTYFVDNISDVFLDLLRRVKVNNIFIGVKRKDYFESKTVCQIHERDVIRSRHVAGIDSAV